MGYYYVTYYTLTPEERRFTGRLMRWSLSVLACAGGSLLILLLILGQPLGGQSGGWVFCAAGWYGLLAAFLLSIASLSGAGVVWALKRYFVDWKVRRQSQGITGPNKFMGWVVFGLAALGVVVFFRTCFLLMWILPNEGLGARVWSKYLGEDVVQTAFAPEGGRFLVWTNDGRAWAWGLGLSVEEQAAPAGPQLGPIYLSSVQRDQGVEVFLRSRSVVLQMKADGSARVVFEVVHGVREEPLDLAAGDEPFACAALSADGKTVLTGGSAGTVRVWDVAGRRERFRLSGHHGPVRCVQFSADGRCAVSGGEDRTAHVWDLSNGVEKRILGPLDQPIQHAAVSLDGGRVVTASGGESGGDYELSVWDVADARVRKTFPWTRESLGPQRLALSPDGAFLLTNAWHEVELWRLP
jgi:hypothetical protein